jgi:hypothetical protein
VVSTIRIIFAVTPWSSISRMRKAAGGPSGRLIFLTTTVEVVQMSVPTRTWFVRRVLGVERLFCNF